MACRFDMPASSSPIEEEFDRAAVSYETGRLASWYKAQGEQVLQALDDSQTGLVVDIGCGTGWLLRRIAHRFPESEGVGIDLSGNMVAVAKEKARDDGIRTLSFVKLDWEGPEDEIASRLGQNSAQAVICASAFHYFTDTQNTLERIFRLLAPDGQFLLLERAKERSWITVFWDVLHRFVIRDRARFYTSEILEEMLQDAGFRDVKVRWRLRKFMWNSKLHTSVVLISARKPSQEGR